MDYSWSKLKSREFEIIACNYVADMFPDKTWHLTKNTGDGNRDFETVPQDERWIKWGEAKHSRNAKTTISKGQLDPTMVSAKLINSVNEVVVVTCAYIPINYVARSCKYIENPITGIYFINRQLLNQWYGIFDKGSLVDFDSKYEVSEIIRKIGPSNDFVEYDFDRKVYIYDETIGDHLTEIKEIEEGHAYSCMVAIFNPSDVVPVVLEYPAETIVIDESRLITRHLSQKEHIPSPKISCGHIEIHAPNGYSVTEFNFNVMGCVADQVNIRVSDASERFSVIKLKHKSEKKSLTTYFLGFQEWLSDYDSVLNRVNESNEEISPALLYNQNRPTIFEIFDDRQGYNFSKICRLLAHMILSVDFRRFDEATLREHLYIADYTDSIEELILSAFTDSIEGDVKDYALGIYEHSVSAKCSFSKETIYCLYDTHLLDNDNREFLNRIIEAFRTKNDNNILITCRYPKRNLNVPIRSEEMLVYVFSSGLSKAELNLNNEEVGEYIRKDLFSNMLYPDYTMSADKIIDSYAKLTTYEKAYFYRRIIEITNNKTNPSGIGEFFSVVIAKQGMHLDEQAYTFLRSLRDVLYDRTDFYESHKITRLLKYFDRDDKDIYLDKCIEADELNHCGLMSESLELLKAIANYKIPESHLDDLYPRKIEALTEIFNLRYWMMETDGLIEEISECIPLAKKLADKGDKRSKYSYYNCLNRKMVTELLLEDYSAAARTYVLYHGKCDADNYLAFAHMDYARGLYKFDIVSANTHLQMAKTILSELHTRGKEERRYLDCKCECAFVSFILADDMNKPQKLKQLKSATIGIRKAGYRSMAFKCHYKLAACYLVLNDEVNARKHLDDIKDSPRLTQSKRHILMYHQLEAAYHILELIKECSEGIPHLLGIKRISFAGSEEVYDDCFYLDPRLW